jgi:hypothetical protein
MDEQKTNWVLYTITIIISFGILMFLNGSLSLSTSFLALPTFTMVYVLISIFSIVIGLMMGLILNKIAKSNKSFIIGCSVVSFLTATIVSIILSVQNKLAAQMQALETEGMGLSGLFGNTPNSFLLGILTIIFFNITPIIIFFRKQEKSMKDLLIYLYSFIIYIILYFLIPFILISTTV